MYNHLSQLLYFTSWHIASLIGDTRLQKFMENEKEASWVNTYFDAKPWVNGPYRFYKV